MSAGWHESQDDDVSAQNWRGRKLCILGLPWDTTDSQLHEFFSHFGTIETARIMKTIQGNSRGFGFVTFSHPEPANAVLQAAQTKELKINGRRIDPKMAVPKGEVVPKRFINFQQRTPRIFVAKIPGQVTADELKQYFAGFGEVTDCYMPRDYVTKATRGIAFVTFATPDTVDIVMGHDHELHGRKLAVDRAEPKAEFNWGLHGGPDMSYSDIRKLATQNPMLSYTHYQQLLQQLQLYEIAGYGSVGAQGRGRGGYPFFPLGGGRKGRY